MAGGQLINDHKSWVGKGKDGVVYPTGAKMKEYSSAEGAGKESEYEDTSEKIKTMQEKNVSKAKARPLKADYRN